MEHRIIRRDGEVRHILARVRIIKDGSGRIVKRCGANQDITERNKAEESLKRSEATLRLLIDATREAVLLVDRSGGILIANETAAERLGTSVGDLVGTRIYDYFPPEIAGPRREQFERVVRTGEPVCFQDERSGRSYETYGYPVVDKKTRVTAVAIFARDITGRKNLEAQLGQAQKMEAVGTLAGGVAHDFNNILTVIMGLSNFIQMSIGKDELIRPYIDQIVASSERAAELTQSLLAFSRKQRITLQPHAVNGVVTSTAKLLGRLLPEDIKLTMSLAGGDTFSLLDITQIGQVLMNLATNARDAMPAGGSLTITTERATLDGSFRKTHGFGRRGEYVKLSVADTGTGMDEHTMEHLFEPFFTTKAVGKGTGLGLASAYGIVKQHNGYVAVSSVPFRGTTFDIYLPLINPPSREEAPASGEITQGTETILIVEDDRDVRNMLTTILESQGYTTIEAVDGDDAIRHCDDHRGGVDLVILDVVMPEKNGKEALDEITRTDPGVKALFVSGYTGDIVIDKGIQSDSVDFLQKPLSAATLLAKVREVLDR
jgi:PAS domain S-box-containing protein